MKKTKVAVLGAGGIIGQHLMISVPQDVEATFVRKTQSALCESLDLTDWQATMAWLDARRPDVIVNLAGESRVDVVEKNPEQHEPVNCFLPSALAVWCDQNDAHYIHASSQAVLDPVSKYGVQKQLADSIVSGHKNWTIVRPTFVLGIRPFPAVGRRNPAELILEESQLKQVGDRYFSISFAWDVAEALWEAARTRPIGKTIQVGNPERQSRWELARILNPEGRFIRTSHDDFEGIALRPMDTTYTDSVWITPIAQGLQQLRTEYQARKDDGLTRRAREIAGFMKCGYIDALSTVAVGFGPLHNAVSADFREANPQTDEQLADWYRKTSAYIWELTAYHLDAGFNYKGMCSGIITRLKYARAHRVLCLGDGIGTLTLALKDAGLDPVYHDMPDSRTAAFAAFRFAARYKNQRMFCCDSPDLLAMGPQEYDAVCSLDFLEHVKDVEGWARAIYTLLKPGGLLIAQNAFNMGSGPEGDMPMHLACNDRFEKDWDPLLAQIGFVQIASNWYEKPE